MPDHLHGRPEDVPKPADREPGAPDEPEHYMQPDSAYDESQPSDRGTDDQPRAAHKGAKRVEKDRQYPDKATEGKPDRDQQPDTNGPKEEDDVANCQANGDHYASPDSAHHDNASVQRGTHDQTSPVDKGGKQVERDRQQPDNGTDGDVDQRRDSGPNGS